MGWKHTILPIPFHLQSVFYFSFLNTFFNILSQFQSWWMQSFIFLRKTWSNQPFCFNATHFNIENSRIFRMLVTCPRSGNGGREVVLQLTEMLCIWIAKYIQNPKYIRWSFLKPLTILGKILILNVWKCSQYASG